MSGNGGYVWHPISENPPKTGTYLVFAPSADPNVPLRTIAFWHSRDSKWLQLAPVWLGALTHWAPFPEDPK